MYECTFDCITFPDGTSMNKGERLMKDQILSHLPDGCEADCMVRLTGELRALVQVSDLEPETVPSGDSGADSGGDPVQGHAGDQNGPSVDSGASGGRSYLTPSGLDAMTTPLDDLLKAQLVEIAQTLGIDPLPDLKAEIQASIEDYRTALKGA